MKAGRPYWEKTTAANAGYRLGRPHEAARSAGLMFGRVRHARSAIMFVLRRGGTFRNLLLTFAVCKTALVNIFVAIYTA